MGHVMDSTTKQDHEYLSPLLGINYGLVHFGLNILVFSYSMWLYKRYSPDNGGALVPIATATLIFMISKIIDAISGPVIGLWSDKTRSKLGRRVPFILAGALPICLVYFFTWSPPASLLKPGSFAAIAYFSFIVCSFWLLFSLVQTPLLSLLSDITSSPVARVKLALFQNIFILLATLIAMGVVPIIVDRYSFTVMGAIFSSVALVAMYLAISRIKEPPVPAGSAERPPFFKSFRVVLSNRQFLLFVIARLFQEAGLQMTIISAPAVVSTILLKPDDFVAVMLLLTMGVAAVSFGLITPILRKMSKKALSMYAMVMFIMLYPAVWFMGQYNLSVTLALPGFGAVHVSESTWAMIIFAIIGFPVAVMMALQSPMTADGIDMGEADTGIRLEAIYYGVHAIATKTALGLAAFIIGQLYSRYGYSTAHHLGVDAVGLAGTAIMAVATMILAFYNYDRKREIAVHAKLHPEQVR